MSYETPTVSTELINTSFVEKVFGGMEKEAQEQASMYIRLKLYEDGILRRLFDHRTVTADELDPLMDSDQPSIICELEPDATKATFIPFKGTGDRMYFNGKRFRVPFGLVEAERISKDKFELMTIRMPIQQWLQENQIKAIQEAEDRLFLETMDDIVKQPDASTIQNITFDLTTGSFKDAFTEGMDAFNKLRLPLGKVLMNKSTYLKSLKLKIEEVGNKPMEDRFNRGVEGEESFLGVPVVTTIKDNLVKDNEMYFFTQQDYFCKFFLLQDATLMLKTEGHTVTFYTYEAPGFGVGNTKGVVKVTLNNGD